ncbi:MAG: hypothetical protein ACE5LU_20505 [Anaerolineae bacterium]
MEARRVVILFQFPLVGRAIERLLETIGGIEVIACMPDEPQGWLHVQNLHPDVVIQVCETERAAAPLLLPSNAVLRLIRLESTGNEMCLYDARQLTATRIEDLIQAIRASGECADRGATGEG